jgi:rfaE bifunctional protein kinase chain/domain
MLTAERLREILDHLPSARTAVVGDFFLDRYFVIDPALSEPSVETGLEARQVVQVRCSPGAAGTVTNNLSALGFGDIRAIGVVGDDGEGWQLTRGLAAARVRTIDLLPHPGIFTPSYNKPMVLEPDGERELERLDIKNRHPLPQSAEEHVLSAVTRALEGSDPVDALIVADQVSERNCGVITDRVRSALAELARRNPGRIVFADSRERIAEFEGVSVKPNRAETARAMGAASVTIEEAGEAGVRRAQSSGRPVFITLSEEGILACTSDGWKRSPSLPIHGPIDVCGAGDSATAGIVAALCAGASPLEAAHLGNMCANITVHKLGTTGTASPDELRRLVSD